MVISALWKNVLFGTEESIFKEFLGQMDVTDPTLPNATNSIPGWSCDIKEESIALR